MNIALFVNTTIVFFWKPFSSCLCQVIQGQVATYHLEHSGFNHENVVMCILSCTFGLEAEFQIIQLLCYSLCALLGGSSFIFSMIRFIESSGTGCVLIVLHDPGAMELLHCCFSFHQI